MRSFARIALCLAGVTVVMLVVHLPSAATAGDSRPAISDGERAAASWAVQNVASRHDYLHGLERNVEEVQLDWVSPTGQFASTATFCLVGGCLHGMDTIMKSYGEQAGTAGTKAALKQLAAIDANVKDAPEYEGAGNSFYQHTNSTPIIEIAGDGKTAKGVWYAPGIDIVPVIEDGKVHIRGGLSWQKMGVDFVKEGSAWKIWHMLVAMDANTPLTPAETAPLVASMGALGSTEAPKPPSRPGPGGPGGPPEFRKPKYIYPMYSPERSNKVWPQLPVPYYAFAETFSYCNCDQQLPSALHNTQR